MQMCPDDAHGTTGIFNKLEKLITRLEQENAKLAQEMAKSHQEISSAIRQTTSSTNKLAQDRAKSNQKTSNAIQQLTSTVSHLAFSTIDGHERQCVASESQHFGTLHPHQGHPSHYCNSKFSNVAWAHGWAMHVSLSTEYLTQQWGRLHESLPLRLSSSQLLCRLKAHRQILKHPLPRIWRTRLSLHPQWVITGGRT
jgi:hypothetical protein